MFFYIDPGTGSMLFTILIGVVSALFYAGKKLWMKGRYLLSGGRVKAEATARRAFVVFSDDKRYFSVFAPILERMEARKMPVSYLTCSKDDPALNKSYEFVETQWIGSGNAAFARMNRLEADIVLSTTPGLDVYQWKRSPGVKRYVHLPHAPSDLSMYRMFGLDYYDAILLSGDFQGEQIRALEEARHLPAKEMVKVGIPYLDVMSRRLETAPPLPAHPTTILLAPSWGPSAILSRFGRKMLQTLRDSEYDVIVRPHPQSFVSEKAMLDELMQEFPEQPGFSWNRDVDNFDVLRRADVLISDFSGVVFEFALVYDKPVIYAETEFDDGPYDSSWLDTPPWTFTTLPKIGLPLTDARFAHLEEAIAEVLTDPRFAEGRENARRECWWDRGAGAENVVRYLEESHANL